MKLSILFFAIFILCSCSRRHSSHDNDTPAALETAKTSSVFKRGPGDMVERIYEELVSKTPGLKELENQIQDASDRKDDSLSDYEKFKEKNEQYYASADLHSGAIADSVLKERIKMLINKSENNYKHYTAGLTDLVKKLDATQITLSDYHEILKLTTTLPFIEKFQKKDLPSKRPIEALVSDYNNLIQKTDSLAGK